MNYSFPVLCCPALSVTNPAFWIVLPVPRIVFGLGGNGLSAHVFAWLLRCGSCFSLRRNWVCWERGILGWRARNRTGNLGLRSCASFTSSLRWFGWRRGRTGWGSRPCIRPCAWRFRWSRMLICRYWWGGGWHSRLRLVVGSLTRHGRLPDSWSRTWLWGLACRSSRVLDCGKRLLCGLGLVASCWCGTRVGGRGFGSGRRPRRSPSSHIWTIRTLESLTSNLWISCVAASIDPMFS